ncbi:peptide-methionine (S)-S-oxide reductase MsrA [Mycoplasma sp. 1654_15]|uniref:peptide-methionine (S)-S-oxide reductase MsrA n=1 Tax=Mycoplasma sp. 1654_15 TaxID=2725994 RepID=UPI0014492244|nr:peptide-methionine (S)-S-oxide reductase MsrA [Mycoplasma sp. 1654_15]QJB71473.1 peptide-methionine (S)-S-oxide reductase MsrA [Mycoplasma sp. 1654_15]
MVKKIYLAAGCFWGVEAFFQRVKGVLETQVCYLNGDKENTTYKQVCSGSGHVEALELIYDSSILSEQEIWNLFLKIVDPFSLNKQGNDVGLQYRIGFYSNEEQLLKVFQKFNNSFENEAKRQTTIEFLPIKNLTIAEEYHQKYLDKNPTGYCHVDLNSVPKNLKK